jgi:hypothetical protein
MKPREIYLPVPREFNESYFALTSQYPGDHHRVVIGIYSTYGEASDALKEARLLRPENTHKLTGVMLVEQD